MSRRAELPTLAHPTLGVRKYTAPTSCACAAVVKVRGVDEATLKLAASIIVMATVNVTTATGFRTRLTVLALATGTKTTRHR
jgi:hypothetical protein